MDLMIFKVFSNLTDSLTLSVQSSHLHVPKHLFETVILTQEMHTAINNLDLCWDRHVTMDRCHMKVRDPTSTAAEESIKCHQ